MIYLADVLAELRKDWPDNRAVHVVCHGHSVPAGYFKTPVVDSLNSYPHLLRVALAERFPHAVLNVIITAIGGETSEGGAARFETQVLVHRPDVLTIDYGLNDRGFGLTRARTAWVSMIEKALALGIKVILLTPTGDLGADLTNPDDPLNHHAEQIRSLAREYGVPLVDSLAATKAYIDAGGKLEDLMSQVNHPNRKGHELVARELIKWFVDEA